MSPNQSDDRGEAAWSSLKNPSHSRLDAAAKATPKGSILIVDDTPANLRLLSQLLSGQGYQVRPVPDGQMALTAAPAEPPDLILLDIRMPGMDGYEVCTRLKEDSRTSDIPIIFISALGETEDKIRAFTTGGVDYVTKPFQVEEVLARIRTHLALRRLQQEIEDANRKLRQELALAGEVQASFLPSQLPHIPGWQVAAVLEPARETSGDFYDFLQLPGGRSGLVVADVADKGAGAALYMALSCTLIRTYAAEYPAQPELVLGAVNKRIMADTRTDMFVTAFYGILDPSAKTLTYCNAGHNPPYLLRAHSSSAVHPLRGTGMLLGVVEDEVWGCGSVEIERGDVLALYTDGIIDAQNAHGESFGKERLLRALRANAGRSARDIQDAVMAEVHEFVDDVPQFDDITLVVVTRES